MIAGILPLDEASMKAARERQNQLTKPAGSLGRLEELAVQLAGITGQVRPRLPRKAVVVMAADHGVVAEGVSAYPAAGDAADGATTSLPGERPSTSSPGGRGPEWWWWTWGWPPTSRPATAFT